MGLNIPSLGNSQSAAITATPATFTIGSWPAVYVLSTVDAWITLDGSEPDPSSTDGPSFFIRAGERLPFYVPGTNAASAIGGGKVSYVRAGTTDGTIYVSEVC